MSYQRLDTSSLPTSESGFYIEGAMLAANMTCQPLPPGQWHQLLFGDMNEAEEKQVMSHYQQQYDALSQPEHAFYTMFTSFSAEEIADFAEGFMVTWPVAEAGWQNPLISDGSLRMLQALLTTWMLAIDEEKTHHEMREAGLTELPSYETMAPNLTLMIQEVFSAADSVLSGSHPNQLNPYKGVSRNDPCPCGSGKKFKHCCLS